MDIRELKNYIYENNYVEQLLESIGCHHIKFHTGKEYWSCANHDGDNQNAIIIYNDEPLICINYTRQMVDSNRTTDLIDLICYAKDLSFPQGIKYICEEIGMSYYHDFNEDIPESFKILQLLDDMDSQNLENTEKFVLKKLDESILSYYRDYVNDLFLEDNIDYQTQKDFEIGFDLETNRYTIPIRNEINELVGIKGRYFYRDVPKDENKYIYLEPCPKSRILYGLYKTLPYIQSTNIVYVCESEKAVLQCWSMGYKNAVACGGKKISQTQIDMLIRTGATIVLALDKDVKKDEIEEIANDFPDGIEIYYIYDEDNILDEKESPSDNSQKWTQLINNNIYKIK